MSDIMNAGRTRALLASPLVDVFVWTDDDRLLESPFASGLELFAPVHRDRAAEHRRRVIEGSGPVSFEAQMLHRPDGPHWFSVSFQRVAGAPELVVTAVRAPLGGTAHDFRTPLNAVLGLSVAMLEGVYGPLNDAQQRSLETIEQSGRALLHVIDRLLSGPRSAALSAPRPRERVAPGPDLPGSGRTVLVIDDEPSAHDTIAALLAREGHHLEHAADARAAFRILEQRPVDLVLCDVMMPEVGGLEVCRTLKAHAHWCTIPIVLVTALDGRDDIVSGLEAGADEFVSKPVERSVLRARVRAMLRIRQQYRELSRSRPRDLDSLMRERREQLASEANLSAREREVLDLLLLGRTQDEIGTALSISARTAKFHQANVLEKLGADSRADLLRVLLS